MKVLVTCPPMLNSEEQFLPILEDLGYEVYCPSVKQTLTEIELIKLVPGFDGWIIGDDPASAQVFKAGKEGKLKASIKWGVGTDNIDFDACQKLGIKIANTPDMFGNEVADLALSYLISLARETYFIDRSIRKGLWPKNSGVSLEGKILGLVGYGDIGKNLANKAKIFGLKTIVYDPAIKKLNNDNIALELWPNKIQKCDFLVFTCALNKKNIHMFNKSVIKLCKTGLRVINVARGPLINEDDLCDGLRNHKIHSAALDVFENEPINSSSYLLEHPLCILGSHNGSNTIDAVHRTNKIAIDILHSFLSN